MIPLQEGTAAPSRQDTGVHLLLQGDCRVVMAALPANSVHSIVCDPPYGISFMGKAWDHGVPGVPVWAECLRVLRPGGHLLAFAGTRTQHRMAVNIEDAGFEIRDMIAWVYGSGFPKSHNLDGDWSGWGTALKPALEPITMARKPLAGTVAVNVDRFGVGALNIDGCRVGGDPWRARIDTGLGSVKFFTEGDAPLIEKSPHDLGRWPANLIHDGSDEVLAAFPKAPGQQAPVQPDSGTGLKTNGILGQFGTNSDCRPRGDTGSAARFFYCAKATKADRNEGLDTLTARPSAASEFRPNHAEGAARGEDGNPYGRWKPERNNHPTVKPTNLMRYLCRLVTPPGGTVLDPFMGSGSTGKGAALEGLRFIGIERDPAYFDIACARVRHASEAAGRAKAQGVLL